MPYEVIFAKRAAKQLPYVKAAGLLPKLRALLAVVEQDPFQNPPPYEKLVGNLAGAYSRRINIQHRLVYEVLEPQHTVHVLSVWTHYEA